MASLDKVLYTARTHTTGGRDGASRSDDGRLVVTHTPPGAPGNGTNPEQLFAAGYSACFIGAIKAVAGKMKLAVPADVAVDADAVIGAVGEGQGPLDAALVLGRACAAASLVGAGDQAFKVTLEYLRTRKQFGKLIGEFQALQHRAAHLFTELELAKAATLAALQAIDAGRPDAEQAAGIAKAKAGRVAELAVQEAVQMHGGVGMTDEFDVGLFMKRVRVLNELLGDAGFHAERLARTQCF